ASGGDFRSGATSTFDRAVHVALARVTGVFAGEEEWTCRAREPRTETGIKRRIEKRVTTASPGVGFPHDLLRGDRLFIARAKPVERSHETVEAVFDDQFAGGIARRSTGHQRENAGAATLFFVSIPYRTKRQ